MTRFLLTICAVAICGFALPATRAATADSAQTQSVRTPGQAATDTADATEAPPAQLIKPRTDQTRPAHPRLGPIDDRCKPLRDQLEASLQKSAKTHRAFQAKLAHNAGTRFCREGKVDKGLAEFQRGLSYLQDETKP